ncbi:MAG: hypothetical protein AAF558_14190 [Verrucomicrobiota bacterium]
MVEDVTLIEQVIQFLFSLALLWMSIYMIRLGIKGAPRTKIERYFFDIAWNPIIGKSANLVLVGALFVFFSIVLFAELFGFVEFDSRI